MSVYVDCATHLYGRMLMCHMVADSREELLAMADAIGVKRKWLQHEGTPAEHFDICQAKRREAIKAGAVEVTSRVVVNLICLKRAAATGIACANPIDHASLGTDEYDGDGQ